MNVFLQFPKNDRQQYERITINPTRSGIQLPDGPDRSDPLDRSPDCFPMIAAARMSLGFQNATVVLCATFLCMVMMFETQLKTNIHDAWIEIAGQGLVVAMAVLSRLGSLANIICVEKDWLIVLAHGSREKLAGESGTVSEERRLHVR